MSTTTILAANATMQSSIAAQQALQAREVACHGFMPSFADAGASIEQKRAYADCVALLYPHAASGGEVLLIKALIVSALIGLFAGAWKGWRDNCDIGEILILAFLGGLLVPFCVGIVFAIIVGIQYVLS